MGKKVRKVVKKVAKVATSPLGMIGGALGMASSREADAAKEAARAREKEEAERRAREDALRAQQEQAQRDANADLRNVDVADVNIGAAADDANSALARKRKQGVSLSESIGLRV